MTIHYLKSWPSEFRRVFRGAKRHEVRRFDRDFQVNDHIVLQEWDPETGQYTGRADINLRITDITMPGEFGLPADIGVLSVVDIHREDED
jgi:hypothetical protein